VFDIEQDWDIMTHEPPDPMVVNEYNDGQGDGGPNPDDLRIDFDGNKNSEWNRGVRSILLEKLLERRDEDDWRLPDRTDEYFEDMIKARLKALTRAWNRTKPRMNESGEMETPGETEAQTVADKDALNKRQRPITRRNHVSEFSCVIATHLTPL
jgi:hypothetical protein